MSISKKNLILKISFLSLISFILLFYLLTFYAMSTSRQDFFTKKASKNWFSSGTIRTINNNQSSSNLWIIIIILLIVVGIGGYFIWKNSRDISFTQTSETAETTGYTIDSQIQEEGILKQDNSDLINYTHTLTNLSGQVFLLKSSKIPLANYTNTLTWTVQIIGTIESFYQGKPLVEVENIGTQTAQDLEQTALPSQNTTTMGLYISKAGLYFGAEFFEHYTFLGTPGENNQIQIQNLENNKTTTIAFFNCSNNWDTNCQQLTQTFKTNAIRTTTSINGDTFYTLENWSHFFQNNNWRGYFIHDADAQEVEKIKNLFTLASPNLISKAVSQHGVKTCLGTDNGLNRILSHTTTKTADNLLITMQGSWEKLFTCQANFDLSKPDQLTFIDIKTSTSAPQQEPTNLKEPQKETQKKEEKSDASPQSTQTSTTPLNPNVPQFATSTDKTFTYTSSKGGYSITLPSMKISYEAFTPSQSFESQGVKCRYGLRVISHTNKDNLQTSPSIIIYECPSTEKLNNLNSNYVIKTAANKTFVIQILDNAWFNFANAISIQ